MTKMAKWMFLLMTLAATIAATLASASHLPVCPPGTFLSKERCESCGSGTYTYKYSRAKSCIDHSGCKEDEKIVRPGTLTSNTACQCLEGEREYSEYDFPTLNYMCKPCPPGKSAKPVIDGLSGDTVCCPNGTVPRRDKSGYPSCETACSTHPPTPGQSQPTPADTQPTPQDSNGTHPGTRSDSWRFDVGSFFIGALVTSVVAAVAILCICLRPKTSKTYDVKKTMHQFFKRKSRQQSPDDQEASRDLRPDSRV